MKILVTGALGHIGSRLVRELPFSFPRVEIVMVDNLSTQRYCSLFNLPKEGNYRFVEADITKIDLAPLLEPLRAPTAALDLARSWSDRVPLRSGLSLAGWLRANGILVPGPRP